MKLLCLYQVMFHYRVGTYEAISKLPNVDFELWHGDDVENTKRINYKGSVGFRHRQLCTFHLPFKTNNGEGSMPYYPFLFFRLIFHNPSVLLVEGASSLLVASVAFVYSKIFRKRIIWWTLGRLKGREYKGVRAILQKWISYMERHADAVFAYSSQARRSLLDEGVENKRIFVGVNVIDTSSKISSVRCSTVEKDPGFNVVFVGAINKTKRLEVLVDAVELLKDKCPDIRLQIIGDGSYLNDVKEYVRSKNLTDYVVFHGRVTEGLNILLSRYQVMVLPGLGGLAIVDGMVSSLPIITGPADGTEIDLVDDSNGYVFPSILTKEDIVDKVLYLYDRPETIKSMGQSSFDKISNKYSFEKYIKVLEECINFVSDEK